MDGDLGMTDLLPPGRRLWLSLGCAVPPPAAARSRRTVHSAQLGSGSGFSQAERAVRGGDTQCGAVVRPAVSDNTQCERTFLVRGGGKVKQDLPVAPQY